jgi:hypothetical protein
MPTEKQKFAFRVYNDLFQLAAMYEDHDYTNMAIKVADKADLWRVFADLIKEV